MIQVKNKTPKELINQLPVEKFEGRIILISTASEADKAIQYLNTQPYVGIDTETRPSFRKGVTHQVALLQVSTQDTCFLFRLNIIGITEAIEQFLTNDVLKIGLSVKDDLNVLNRRKQFANGPGNWIELQGYAARFGIEDKSLQKLYANLYGMKISKKQRLTNWEAEHLSDAQQHYAALDAWACVQLYDRLQEMERTQEYELTIVESIETEHTDELQENILEAR